MSAATRLLLFGLFGLAALFLFWFSQDGWPTLLVFAGPPLLLGLGAWRGGHRAPFWAAVLALLWFSHGVMVAWSRPLERELAFIEIGLALLVVFAASLPGLRARFPRRR
jgi:uncharacterized membrane protein